MQLVAEVGILYSQGLSMIGKWKRQKGCCVGSGKGKKVVV